MCARELATNTVLSRPAVRAHFEELLLALAASQAAAQQDLAGKLRGIMTGEGPDPMLGAAAWTSSRSRGCSATPKRYSATCSPRSPGGPRTSSPSLAVVVDAYADHIATRVGAKLVGAHAQLAEAWYRRRTERGKGEEAAGALFGLDLDQAQVDRGRAFVAGVVERAGDEALARLWEPVRNLPTPAEVDAPGLWLERIDLPELGRPDRLTGAGQAGRCPVRPGVGGRSGRRRPGRRGRAPPRAARGPTRAGCSPARRHG